MRAAAYVRYSSDNQRTESIDAQIRAIEEYCQRKGHILVATYIDEALTATTDNRPQFRQMITDAGMRKFEVAIVHKLDRFARDRYDSAFYKRELKKGGARLESVLEQLDGSPESIILESVLEGMAEYYSKNLARETRKGLKENALEGKHTGGRPPYGYKINPATKRLELDEKTAPAVRVYFESMAEGVPLNAIADKLNKLGYRTYSGRLFTKNSFWDWAQNKKYIGIFTWDVREAKNPDGTRNNHRKRDVELRVQIDGAVPAIVDKNLWEKVNQVLESRKKNPNAAKAKTVYLLTDLVFCGSCGAPMRGSTYRNFRHKDDPTQAYSYYRCSAKCGNKHIDRYELEHEVLIQVLDTCFTTEAEKRIVGRVRDLYEQQQRQSAENDAPVRTEIRDLERRIDNWLELIGDGVDKAILVPKINQANERKRILEQELQRIALLQSAYAITDDMIITALKKKKSLLMSEDPRIQRQTITELVEQIIVHYDNASEKHWIKLTVRIPTGVGNGT